MKFNFRLILIYTILFVPFYTYAKSIKYNFINNNDNKLFRTSMVKTVKDDMEYGSDRYFVFTAQPTPNMIKVNIDAKNMGNFQPHPDDVGYTMFDGRLVIVRNVETVQTLSMSRVDSVERIIHYEENPIDSGNRKNWIFVYNEGKIILEWYCDKPVPLNDSVRVIPDVVDITEYHINDSSHKTSPKFYSLFKVDERPSFPGGDEALQQWIDDNFVFPDAVKREGRKRIISLIVIISKDGDVVLRDDTVERIEQVYTDLSDDIYRLFDKMPKWTPGKINGEAVDVIYTLNWHYPKRE